jgi:hypothetical protein
MLLRLAAAVCALSWCLAFAGTALFYALLNAATFDEPRWAYTVATRADLK